MTKRQRHGPQDPARASSSPHVLASLLARGNVARGLRKVPEHRVCCSRLPISPRTLNQLGTDTRKK